MSIERKISSKGIFIWQTSSGKVFKTLAEAMQHEHNPSNMPIKHVPSKGADKMRHEGEPNVGQQYLVESYMDYKKGYIRIRPCPGQGVHSHWNLRFPKKFREDLEPGVKFMVALKTGRSHYMPVGTIQWLQTVDINMRGQEQSRSRRPNIKPNGKPKAEPKMGKRKIQFKKEE